MARLGTVMQALAQCGLFGKYRTVGPSGLNCYLVLQCDLSHIYRIEICMGVIQTLTLLANLSIVNKFVYNSHCSVKTASRSRWQKETRNARTKNVNIMLISTITMIILNVNETRTS